MTIFETLIGESGTTAGNHRCMPSDVAGVRGGQGCILPAPGCAVRRQALRRWSCVGAAGSAVSGVAGARCIVVSLGGWRAPEEARSIWRGGRRDGCSTKEGLPGSSRLQHALMPNSGHCEFVYTCAGLYAIHGRSDRQFSIVIRIRAAPTRSGWGLCCTRRSLRADCPVLPSSACFGPSGA